MSLPPFPPDLPRTALVTGGAQRLGAAISRALATAGFRVAIHYNTSQTQAVALAHELDRAVTLQADLADEAATATLIQRATAALGPIGVLVNNASVFERDEWHDVTRTSWDRHLEPNLRAPFTLMQAMAAALPPEAQGAIVNLLDQRVWSLTPHFVSYTLSKAALWSLTQQMALALAPRIRVNAIGPGPALPSAPPIRRAIRPPIRQRPAPTRHQPRRSRPRRPRPPRATLRHRPDARPRRRPTPAMVPRQPGNRGRIDAYRQRRPPHPPRLPP